MLGHCSIRRMFWSRKTHERMAESLLFLRLYCWEWPLGVSELGGERRLEKVRLSLGLGDSGEIDEAALTPINPWGLMG